MEGKGQGEREGVRKGVGGVKKEENATRTIKTLEKCPAS